MIELQNTLTFTAICEFCKKKQTATKTYKHNLKNSMLNLVLILHNCTEFEGWFTSEEKEAVKIYCPDCKHKLFEIAKQERENAKIQRR